MIALIPTPGGYHGEIHTAERPPHVPTIMCWHALRVPLACLRNEMKPYILRRAADIGPANRTRCDIIINNTTILYEAYIVEGDLMSAISLVQM